jgi:hypothetical protein
VGSNAFTNNRLKGWVAENVDLNLWLGTCVFWVEGGLSMPRHTAHGAHKLFMWETSSSDSVARKMQPVTEN